MMRSTDSYTDIPSTFSLPPKKPAPSHQPLNSQPGKRKSNHSLPGYNFGTVSIPFGPSNPYGPDTAAKTSSHLSIPFASSNPYGPDAPCIPPPVARKYPPPRPLAGNAKVLNEEELARCLQKGLDMRRTKIYGEDSLTPESSISPLPNAEDHTKRCAIRSEEKRTRFGNEDMNGLEDITSTLGLTPAIPIVADAKNGKQARAAGPKVRRGDKYWTSDVLVDDSDFIDDLFDACEEEGFEIIKNEPQSEYNGIAPSRQNNGWMKQMLFGDKKGR